MNRQHRLEHHARDAVSHIAQAKLHHRTDSPVLLAGFREQSKADHDDKIVDVLGRRDAATGREYTQRADKELKAPPALEGSAMVARPTRPQIFAVN